MVEQGGVELSLPVAPGLSAVTGTLLCALCGLQGEVVREE